MVRHALPPSYQIPYLLTVFLAGDGWRVFLPNITVSRSFSTMFFAATIRITRRRVA